MHPKNTNFRSGSKLQVSIHNLMKVVMLFNYCGSKCINCTIKISSESGSNFIYTQVLHNEN